MGITDPADCSVFDEADGTEIDDDECLALYDNTPIFIIGAEWKPVASPVPSPVASLVKTSVSLSVASSPPTTPVTFPDVASVVFPISETFDADDSTSETSVGGYKSWIDHGFDMFTSTPCTTESSDEGKPDGDCLQQLEETAHVQPSDHGSISQQVDTSCSTAHRDSNKRKKSVMEEVLGSELKKKKIDGKLPV